VPGQKLGSAFLPMLIGAGLLVCAVLLMLRRAPAPAATAPRAAEHYASAAVMVAAVLAYLLWSERVGFLLIAPPCLMAVFLALRVRWPAALAWSLLGTLGVHLVFYKLLRVPLPWGWLTPLY
jgi:putative tricarboxylic transport membrane protein